MMQTAGADDLDYLIWRLVTSEHLSETLKTVQSWSLSEIARAHLALDIIEVLTPEPEPPKANATPFGR